MRCKLSVGLLLCAVLVFAATAWSEEQPKTNAEAEPELTIVKYGSLSIQNPVPGAKIYIDDVYKGGADSVVENIIVGEHVVSCRTDEKSVSGTFLIKKNETLRLEARFDAGKLVVFRERQQAEAPPAPAAVKQEKTKKPPVEPRKVEPVNSAEARWKAHLNVMKLGYQVTDAPEVVVEHEANQGVIAKYSEKHDRTGTFYRTRQGVLLCDAGPCELAWQASFSYTDETGKADAVLFRWKETVFNGSTPAGTSKQELEWCINGQCRKYLDASPTDSDKKFEEGRYELRWTKTSVRVRRADLVKEIVKAGRAPGDY